MFYKLDVLLLVINFIVMLKQLYTISPFVGKWSNMFSCTTKVTNTGKENISVTDVTGYYKNKGMNIRIELIINS